MIEKKNCKPGVVVIVNSKPTQWNIALMMQNNGLHSCLSTMLGEMGIKELLPGTKLVIIQPPRKIKNITLVEYKVLGEELNRFSYWIAFKHKVDPL